MNGSRLKAFDKGKAPTNHLYKNNRDGTFTDVTQAAGLVHSGWAGSCCIGDYDNVLSFNQLRDTLAAQAYWGMVH